MKIILTGNLENVKFKNLYERLSPIEQINFVLNLGITIGHLRKRFIDRSVYLGKKST